MMSDENDKNQVDNEDDYQVHLVQTLLTVNEVFVYRIPPMKTSGGHRYVRSCRRVGVCDNQLESKNVDCHHYHCRNFQHYPTLNQSIQSTNLLNDLDVLYHSRAEDWDLSNPLKTCRLTVDRMDQSCWIQLFVDSWKPLPTTTNDANAPTDHDLSTTTGVRKVESSLFCRSIITVTPTDDNNNTTATTSKVRHMVEPVVDSSRYFVVKIQNTAPTSNNNNNNNTSNNNNTATRTAHIGVGFRERDDASNFLLALQDYEKSRHREFQATKMLEQYEREQQQQQNGLASEEFGELERDTTTTRTTTTTAPPLISKLTLKEGETIRITLKGLAGSAAKEHKKATSSCSSSTTGSVGGTTIPLLKKKPPMLLKPPPPPPPPSSNVEDGKIAATQGDDDEDEWTDFQES
jgi:hypothetical protein